MIGFSESSMDKSLEVDVLTANQLADWDVFVAAHPEGSIFHTSRWADVLERAFPHMKASFLAVRDPDSFSIIAGIPVFLVASPLLGRRLVSVPFSTWCSPLVSHRNQFGALLGKLESLRSEKGNTKLEIRCRGRESCGNLPSEWKCTPKWLHHALNLEELSSPEALWSKLPRTALRQVIRKAEKSNVRVTVEAGVGSAKEFFEPLVDSRKRIGLPMIPLRYFESLVTSFTEANVCFLHARKGERLLGSALLYFGNGICHYELIGEFSDRKEAGTMQIITWNAIKLAIERGCTEFSFGRTSVTNRGLIDYKRRWQAVEEPLSVLAFGEKEGDEEAASCSPSRTRLWMEKVFRIMPRRLYVIAGRFIYSHWG